MAVEKIVGKAITKVGFKTDLASYRRAVKQIDDIKKKMQGLKKVMKNASFTASIKDSRDTIRRARETNRKVAADVHDSHVRVQEKLAKHYEKQFTKAELNLRRKRAQASKRSQTRSTRVQARGEFFESLASSSKLNPAQIDAFRRRMAVLNNEYQKGNIATQIYTERTRQVISGLRRASAQTRTLRQEMSMLRSSFVAATASATVFSAGVGITDVGKKFQALEVGTRTVFGKEGAANNLRFLNEESERLGFRLLDTTKDFTKFAVAAEATSLKTAQVRDIFSGTMEASRVFGLSGEQNALVLKALAQILSKGTVQMEEFDYRLLV